MIGVAWLALVTYAENPSAQIQWLQSGVVAALVTALVMGAVSLRNQRVSAAPENRRVSLDEFKELRDEYREKIAEQGQTIDGLRVDLSAKGDKLAEQDRTIGHLQENLLIKDREIQRLMDDVRALRLELGGH